MATTNIKIFGKQYSEKMLTAKEKTETFTIFMSTVAVLRSG